MSGWKSSFGRFVVAGGAVVGLIACGCSSGEAEFVPVRGTIVLDGKPLALKQVVFSPEAGTPGLGSGALTQADGSFELLATVGGAVKTIKGVRPGEYRVTVVEPATEGSVELARPNEGVRIPTVYTDRQTTPLVITVGTKSDAIEIELHTKAKKARR
jgi:hypothetical protein